MCILTATSTGLFAFWSPGPLEMMLLLGVALLLYGGRLPEVARSWGKNFAEFRRSLSGIQNEINEAIYAEPDRLEYHESSPLEEQQTDSASDNSQSEIRTQEGD